MTNLDYIYSKDITPVEFIYSKDNEYSWRKWCRCNDFISFAPCYKTFVVGFDFKPSVETKADKAKKEVEKLIKQYERAVVTSQYDYYNGVISEAAKNEDDTVHYNLIKVLKHIDGILA